MLKSMGRRGEGQSEMQGRLCIAAVCFVNAAIVQVFEAKLENSCPGRDWEIVGASGWRKAPPAFDAQERASGIYQPRISCTSDQ